MPCSAALHRPSVPHRTPPNPLKSLAQLLLAASLLLPLAARANFAECAQFFPGGKVPVIGAKSPTQQRQLCFDAFAVLHSGQSKTAVYVVERLNRAQLDDARDETRTNRFYEEARLPSADRSKLADYKSALRVSDAVALRFDRGHMAPAADMPTAGAMAQSFSLANMVPQAPENNRKTWARIEKATRQYVARASGDVYVFSGPVYAAQPETLGPGKVWIPEHLFKLVYDAGTNRAWAHWVANTDAARQGPPISYDELVKRTGVQFLPGLTPQP